MATIFGNRLLVPPQSLVQVSDENEVNLSTVVVKLQDATQDTEPTTLGQIKRVLLPLLAYVEALSTTYEIRDKDGNEIKFDIIPILQELQKSANE